MNTVKDLKGLTFKLTKEQVNFIINTIKREFSRQCAEREIKTDAPIPDAGLIGMMDNLTWQQNHQK